MKLMIQFFFSCVGIKPPPQPIANSNWFISLLARSWEDVSYCFESFPCAVKAGASFVFLLAVKTCCCSDSFEEVEVSSFGLVVSGVDDDVIVAFYEIYSE